MPKGPEIDAFVRQQIGDRWGETNLHHVDLRRSIVPARLQTCVAGWDPELRFDVWIVLEEHPGSRDGYKIAYDPEKQSFGLMTSNGPTPCFLGYYGEFFDAFASM